MESTLTVEEQTLLAVFRNLDETGKKELLRYASKQQQETSVAGITPAGQCKLAKVEERPEIAAEPIFTE
jgi:hypothetical protein